MLNDDCVITRERAVELVQSLLVTERQASAVMPDLAVSDVEEHVVGWLVFWQSAEYLRTREWFKMLVGNGPYLVDKQDGSIHQIPVTTLIGENWEELYLEQVKGIMQPDPLLSSVRDVVLRDGAMAAVRHLRKQAPQFTVQEAKAYVDALRDGGEPPEELTRRTRARTRRAPLAIETLAGPANEAPRA